MKLNCSFPAAAIVAALTFGTSFAQAQFTVMQPVASGSAITLPYGGYYGPALSPSPIISYGAPFYSPDMGGYGYGGYGYGQYDANGFGSGNYGFSGNGPENPFAYTGVGDIANGTTGDRTVNGTRVQGGIVDPTDPANSSPDQASAARTSTGANSQQASGAAALRNIVAARRAPYNRVAIAYRGDIRNAASVTIMLLNRRGRELQQEVLTSAPAETQMRLTTGAKYYRVIVNYLNGTSRSYTRAINLK